MKFTISAVLALAVSATAMSLSESPALHTAVAKCATGDIACCDSKDSISGDGILGNLLAKGALNGLLGNDDAACAKASAIDDLGVLATQDNSSAGPTCKNIIACCPKGTGKCEAIDSSS